MTKTEMAELGAEYIRRFQENVQLTGDELVVFNRSFKELFDDFRVKLQEQVEVDIEEEEQEFIEETEQQEETGAFGGNVMEGE